VARPFAVEHERGTVVGPADLHWAAAAWIHPEHPSLLMIGEAFAGRAASAAPAQCPGAPHVLAA
ncbi:hypothetical protein ACQUWY_26670, partial [Ralstonia pseudosolanacearum]